MAEFDRDIRRFYSAEELAQQAFRARNRGGKLVYVPLLSISLGVVQVPKEHDASLLDVSAAAANAKGQAKQKNGSALFVERRYVFGADSVQKAAQRFVVE